jgi:hypothetical protein
VPDPSVPASFFHEVLGASEETAMLVVPLLVEGRMQPPEDGEIDPAELRRRRIGRT